MNQKEKTLYEKKNNSKFAYFIKFSKENLISKLRHLYANSLTKVSKIFNTIKEIRESNILELKFTDLDLCKLKPNYNNFIKEHSHAK